MFKGIGMLSEGREEKSFGNIIKFVGKALEIKYAL